MKVKILDWYTLDNVLNIRFIRGDMANKPHYATAMIPLLGTPLQEADIKAAFQQAIIRGDKEIMLFQAVIDWQKAGEWIDLEGSDASGS